MNSEATYIEPVEAQALPWQLDLVKQLVELKRQQKLPHALLIELQTSVDSIAFGWYLVTALLCESDTELTPCGNCKPCELMRSNNYPDFTYTSLQENDKTQKLNKDIKIDQIRKLIHQMTLTNNLQAGKYALIYPAEKMNQSAANSLLKTLEEPSNESTLILLSHHSSRLPVTIRSRCQKWLVNNPETSSALQWLMQQKIEDNQAEAYLSLANNDAQLAYDLYQQQYQQDYQFFSQQLSLYFDNQIDVNTLVNSLKNPDSAKIRHIFKNELMNSIHLQLESTLTQDVKQKVISLLDLMQQSEQYLQVEDNNLNLLLQLEDVLISMKQIINRG